MILVYRSIANSTQHLVYYWSIDNNKVHCTHSVCKVPREDNMKCLERYPRGDNECNVAIIME